MYCSIYLWLGSIRVIDLWSVIPVLRLLGFWVGDLLGREEVPVILKATTFNTFVVNLHLVGVVRANDEGVKVSKLIILWWEGEREREEQECNINLQLLLPYRVPLPPPLL